MWDSLRWAKRAQWWEAAMTLLAAAMLLSSLLSWDAGKNLFQTLKEDLTNYEAISRLEYEYIAKGFIFRKGRIKVTVSRVGITIHGFASEKLATKVFWVIWPFPRQVYKIGNNPPSMDNLEPVTGSWLVCITIWSFHQLLHFLYPFFSCTFPTQSYLITGKVELSVLAPSGNDAVGEDMKNFADQLRPLVIQLILINLLWYVTNDKWQTLPTNWDLWWSSWLFEGPWPRFFLGGSGEVWSEEITDVTGDLSLKK